jgi:cell division septum initiation protein DivIVA
MSGFGYVVDRLIKEIEKLKRENERLREKLKKYKCDCSYDMCIHTKDNEE